MVCLTPPGFFLQGYLTIRVYVDAPKIIPELKDIYSEFSKTEQSNQSIKTQPGLKSDSGEIQPPGLIFKKQNFQYFYLFIHSLKYNVQFIFRTISKVHTNLWPFLCNGIHYFSFFKLNNITMYQIIMFISLTQLLKVSLRPVRQLN